MVRVWSFDLVQVVHGRIIEDKERHLYQQSSLTPYFYAIIAVCLQSNLKMMLEAVRKNDVEKASKLLSRGFDPNFIDTDTGGLVWILICILKKWFLSVADETQHNYFHDLAAAGLFIIQNDRRVFCQSIRWSITIVLRIIRCHWFLLLWPSLKVKVWGGLPVFGEIKLTVTLICPKTRGQAYHRFQTYYQSFATFAAKRYETANQNWTTDSCRSFIIISNSKRYHVRR